MSWAVWDEWVDSQAESVKAQGRWRRLRPLEGMGPDFRLADGSGVISFASNDYLGLSTHAAVRAAAHDALERWGAGSGSSRLIVGDRPIHTALEDDIAAWRNSEAALVFPTGFQTNLGVLTTFGAGARIVSDELNHASIIDGARLAKAQVTVYRHGDVEEAAHLVAGAPGRALVVTDTVFSMDGDVADVEGLSEMCARANALLVLDDAHAVFGEGAAAARCHGVPAGGNPVEGARLPGRIRGRPPVVDRPADQPGPQLHLHYRPGAHECGGRPRRSGHLPVIRGGRPARHAATPTSTPSAPATARPSSRS